MLFFNCSFIFYFLANLSTVLTVGVIGHHVNFAGILNLIISNCRVFSEGIVRIVVRMWRMMVMFCEVEEIVFFNKKNLILMNMFEVWGIIIKIPIKNEV